MTKFLGVDVGATGIKGAIVDTKKGVLVTDRKKYKTPSPATPDAVTRVIQQLITHFDWQGKDIGICIPAIVKKGVSHSASNIHDLWLGYPAKKAFEKAFKCKVSLLNDADSAGLAEMTFGITKGGKGTIILLTLGTGIGSSFFVDGKLLPNTELGHLYYKDSVAEKYVANSARKRKELSWEEWAKEFDKYLQHLEFLFSPDMFVLGGGISKEFDKYKEYLTVETKVSPARLLNNAGIIGAAIVASQKKNR